MHHRTGLYSLLIQRLEELHNDVKKEIIPFPLVFSKICRNFSLSKQQGWDILFLLRDVGLIEIVPYHGIKLIPPT